MHSTPAFWIEVLEGADQGRTIPVSGKKITLGRKIPSREKLVDTSHDSKWILFEEPSVSRIHALMEWDDTEKAYSLSHQSRTNSTLVNTRAVEKQFLQGGDVVKMGLLVFTFREEGQGIPARDRSAEFPAAPPPQISGGTEHRPSQAAAQEPGEMAFPEDTIALESRPPKKAAEEQPGRAPQPGAGETAPFPESAESPEEPSILAYELEVVQGADRGRLIPVSGMKIMVGRRIPSREKLVNTLRSTKWILLDDESVSRIHALLEWDDHERTYLITHKSGTNSTMVNSAPIERTALRNGDMVKMGLLEFIFRAVPVADQAREEKPEPPPRPRTTPATPLSTPHAWAGRSLPTRPSAPLPAKSSALPVDRKAPGVPDPATGPSDPPDPGDRVKIIAAPIISERPGKKKRFEFSAVNRSGEELFGIIDADEEAEVIREMTDRRLTIVNMTVMKVHPPPAKDTIEKPPPGIRPILDKTGDRYASLVKKLHPISEKTLFVFTHQLATMLGAGITINRGIETIMTAEPDRRFREILKGLMHSFTGGSSAYNAFSRYPEVFSKAYRGIIAIGESSGRLPYILERQARDLEKLFNFKHKVLASLTYPFMVLIFSLLAVVFMMLYFVPSFTEIYKESQARLPLLTTMLVFSVQCLTSARFWLFAIIISVVSSFVLSNYLHTPIGRNNYDTLILRLPVLGKVISASEIYSLLLNLACMLECGLHIRESLVILKDMTANSVLGDALDQVIDSIEGGESFHDTLRHVWFIPGFVKDLIQAGESSGELPLMVRKAAYMLEEQVNGRLEAFLSILEPVVLSILACMVGGIMIAIFLPISNIINTIAP